MLTESTALVDRNVAPNAVNCARVLHLINGEHYSGAERVQDLLANQLPAEGFEVGFACLKPNRFPSMRQSSCRLHEMPMRYRTDWAVVRRLVRLVHDEGYSILHAHTPRTALIGRAISIWTGLPLVYHVHSPTSRDSTRFLQNALNHFVELACIGGAERLITVSQSLAQHMRRQGVSPSRIAVVPNGVPAARKRHVGITRNKSQTPASWTLGMVALIRPRKGIEVLLEALAILRRDGFPVRLRAVGPFETPEYQSAVLARAERLGVSDAIDWVGFTRDVETELHQMDLFVLPSLFGEGLPMVVLEAMAVGLPVVSTRVEGIPEAVRDGVDGLLANPNDPHDLARVLRRVVQGQVRWADLSSAAFEQHADRFSDRAMARGVAAVYREILGG